MDKNYRVKNFINYTYIEFYGDIDDSVCPRYRKEISNLIEQNKSKDMILNFKEVTFIDSSGIGLILGRYNQLKGHRKKLYITETNSQIKKLFKISGIYTIIDEVNIDRIGVK